MSVLRVGVVGVGGISQMMHLPTLTERPDLFRVVALADADRETLEAVGRRHGVASLHTSAAGVLAAPDVDAVVLATSGSHAADALAALAARKHVFVEKPLGMTVAETQAVADAARGAGVTLMVGYHKRYDPAVTRARELVRALDDLRFVEVTVLHPEDAEYRTHHAILPPRPRRPEPPDAAREPRAVGVEMLWTSLIHDLNLLRAFLGEPEAVLSSHLWQGGWAQTSLVRFPREVRAQISWIYLAGLKHYEERLRFVSPKGRVTLTFPSPYLRHFPTALEVERMDGGGSPGSDGRGVGDPLIGELVVEHRTVSYEEAFRAELHRFRESALSGQTPETDADDALGDARLIDAIARAWT